MRTSFYILRTAKKVFTETTTIERIDIDFLKYQDSASKTSNFHSSI